MKMADSEALRRDDYLMISDHWRQEWEKGVQVPVNPAALKHSQVRCVAGLLSVDVASWSQGYS